MLSIEHAIVSDVGGIIEDWLPQDVHGMALYLCYERARGRDSPLHPYVNALPTAINTPLFWSVSERAHLKGTNAEEVTLQRERDLKEAYGTGLLRIGVRDPNHSHLLLLTCRDPCGESARFVFRCVPRRVCLYL